MLAIFLLVCGVIVPQVEARNTDVASGCRKGQSGYAFEQFSGTVREGQRFSRPFGPRFVFALAPIKTGWYIRITRGKDQEDLSRLTPPWHFVPSPRYLEGWHFRNVHNTGPNDGSVNAPQEQRDFMFSPEVGDTIDGPAAHAQPTREEMDRIAAFGTGRLHILRYRLSNLEPGQRAASR